MGRAGLIKFGVLVLFAAFIAGACDDEEGDGGNDGGADTDTDTDSDADADGDGEMDEFVMEQMEVGSIPGLAAAVVAPDQVLWSKAYGYRNIEQQLLATVDTPFNLGSISKSFIGVSIMKEIEKGTLDLSTSLSSAGLSFQVDNPHIEDEEITFGHLVTHTSGILDSDFYSCAYYVEDNGMCLEPLINPNSPCPVQAVTDMGQYLQEYLTPGGSFYDENANFLSGAGAQPGTVYEYSNVASALSAHAFGNIVGTTFDQYCEEEILDPLGMNDTHWHLSQFSDLSSVATRYSWLDGEQTAIPHFSLSTWPDGGLYASVTDLGIFLAMIMNGGEYQGERILEEASVDAMISSQIEAPIGPGITQGVFWYKAGDLVGHNGGDPGCMTEMYFNPITQLGVIILANTDDEYPPSINAMAALSEKLFQFGENLQR